MAFIVIAIARRSRGGEEGLRGVLMILTAGLALFDGFEVVGLVSAYRLATSRSRSRPSDEAVPAADCEKAAVEVEKTIESKHKPAGCGAWPLQILD
jgi:hypothetical protein